MKPFRATELPWVSHYQHPQNGARAKDFVMALRRPGGQADAARENTTASRPTLFGENGASISVAKNSS